MHTNHRGATSLALALAQKVKTCHFTNPRPRNGIFQRAVDHFTLNKSIVAMKNICKLQLSNRDVYPEDWNAIVALPSLDNLSSHDCYVMSRFLVGLDQKKWLKVKVSRLSMVECICCQELLAATDMGCLRMLTMDLMSIEDAICFAPRCGLASAVQRHRAAPSCFQG